MSGFLVVGENNGLHDYLCVKEVATENATLVNDRLWKDNLDVFSCSYIQDRRLQLK